MSVLQNKCRRHSQPKLFDSQEPPLAIIDNSMRWSAKYITFLVNVHIIVVVISASGNTRNRTCRAVSHGMNEGARLLFDGAPHFLVNVLAHTRRKISSKRSAWRRLERHKRHFPRPWYVQWGTTSRGQPCPPCTQGRRFSSKRSA